MGRGSTSTYLERAYDVNDRYSAITTDVRLKHFLYALHEGVEGSDAIQILTLVEDPGALPEVWPNLEMEDGQLFFSILKHITGKTCFWCEDCDGPTWAATATTVESRGLVCKSCLEDHYSFCIECEEWCHDDKITHVKGGVLVCEECKSADYSCCDKCGGWFPDDDITEVSGGNQICDRCLARHYSKCEGCDTWFRDCNTTTIDGEVYCDETCLDQYTSWCDECDESYLERNSDDHEHRSNCDCDAPRLKFRFPANGHGTIRQDEQINVELPAGTISPEGIGAIISAVRIAHGDQSWYDIRKVVESLNPMWQLKAGNFTRRLSKAMHKELGVKITPSLLSAVGNIAHRHTARGHSFWISLTRDLNGSAKDFYNEDSCWWTDHSNSRCALKQWGGLGLLSYPAKGSWSPIGRAWVQPLDSNLKPTHDTVNAHAYVVYNGYGNMEEYTPARILAHLTGRTYRRIDLHLSPQYVNGNVGYLVADEETCNNNDSLTFTADEHDQTDHLEVAA